MRPDRSSQSGFTLIELMIAVAIFGLAILFAIPGITQWIQNSQIRTAAENIRNGIEYARMEAVRTNMPVEFSLTNPGAVGGTGWSARIVRTGAIIQSKPDGEASATAVLAPFPDNATMVTFTGLGRVQTNNTDGTAPMTSIGVDSSTVTGEDSRELRITISTGGEVRMCDPNVTEIGDPRRC